MKVQRKLPRGWWLYPTFDFGVHYPAPYIWFAYWLITWDTWDDDDYWKIFGFRVPKISIEFLPD